MAHLTRRKPPSWKRYLTRDEAARQLYVRYLDLHGELHWRLNSTAVAPLMELANEVADLVDKAYGCPAPSEDEEVHSPVLGFLGSFGTCAVRMCSLRC